MECGRHHAGRRVPDVRQQHVRDLVSNDIAEEPSRLDFPAQRQPLDAIVIDVNAMCQWDGEAEYRVRGHVVILGSIDDHNPD